MSHLDLHQSEMSFANSNVAIEKARQARETLQKTARLARKIRRNIQVDETWHDSEEELQTDLIIGKSVNRIVATPTGTLLLAPGQRIAPSTIETAEHWGMLDELFQAVAQSDRHDFTTDSSCFASELADDLPSCQSLSSTAMGTEECGIRAIEERRCQSALGQAVHRTIIDRNGEAILESGERVTPEALDRAKRSGILDILFSAVLTEEPELVDAEIVEER
jgi:hypothetical protein